MTDREKLVKLINEGIEIYSDGWQKSFAASETIVDHLIANGVTVQNWRDVKTEPPKEWKGADESLINYLVYCPEYGVDVGNYVEPAKRWIVVGLPAPVTRWMPLPEPPKEEEA